jgi:RIO kinase 1
MVKTKWLLVSPSKRPPKDEFLLKERKKIESEVFDKETLVSLAKIMKKGIIKTVDFPISTGKEANVFRATTPGGTYVAVKIYKIETSPFFRKEEYIIGDPRFEKIKDSDKDIVIAFAHKEFKNLEICEEAGVHAPKPLYIEKHILVMSFLGEGGLPYAPMNVVNKVSKQDVDIVLNDIKKMYKAGLVHADLSEYNILRGDVPYLVDFGQGVVTAHPKANEFLERDVSNVLKYFAKFGYKFDKQKILDWIVNC